MNVSRFYTLFLLLIFLGFKSFAQNPQVEGKWSDPIPFDIVPVAVANLPDGRLLTWSSKYHDNFGGADGFTFTQIFDPSIGLDGATLPETVTNTNHDMFCPGINNLADGRILATGGSSSERASIYNPVTETWSSAGDMNIPRGYQGAVTLSDGSAFTIGGSWSGGQGDKDAEIWTAELGWRVLPGLQNELLWNIDDDNNEPQGVYRLDNHAWLFAAPNGKIFHAGPGETMHWLDVSGNGSSTVVGNRGDDIFAINGSAVMFDIGKILKFGGSFTYSNGSPSSDNAYVIDINDENNVTVTPTLNAAAEGRIYSSSVALPTGDVLVLGGMDTSVPFSDTGAHLSAELYHSDTNMFTTVASMQIPRTYHSAGILLNDGRIFYGGGGLCGNCGNLNHKDAQIYSPPYLFDSNGDLAARPSLSAPDNAFYDSTLSVLGSTDITEFAFMRMSSATHSVNNEQRRIPVTFSGSNGTYQLNVPNANLMPPGYYMLFAINSAGVPSISKAVLVGADSRIKKDNLLVEFDFFEGNGTLVTDTSGKNNNGVIKERDNAGNEIALTADYWNAEGFSGSALQMDGMEFNSNSLLEIPASPTLSALTDQITVMAWVNRNTGSVIPQNGAIPNVAIFAHDYGSFFFGYHNSLYKLEFFTDNGGQASCYTGTYNPGEWDHVVGTYDGTMAKLYVNGQQICSSAVTGNLQINTLDPFYNTFTLSGFYDKRNMPVVPYGNSSGITDELDGSMDKFKLYNVALTAQEIQEIYTNEKSIVIDDKACENLSIVYEVNGQSGTGDSEITVNQGDDVSLSLSSEDVDYTLRAPDGSILSNNLLENITIAQSGLYSINSPLNEFQQTEDSTILFVDSEELTNPQDGSAANAIDGNTNTFWHTEWYTVTTQYPHEIQIDLGEQIDVLGLDYLPRQDGSLNGTIAGYEIYISNSPSNWGTSVASGTWAYNRDLKTVFFPEMQGRYLRLVAISEGNGNPWASAAEIRALTSDNQCVKTLQINVENPITYTYTNAWSPSDPNGVATTVDTIIINEGEAVISSNTSCRTLIIEPGAALTVDAGVTLIANETTLNSTSQLYSSLIVDGEVIGEVNYKRHVNVIGSSSGGGNDLISSPVESAIFNGAFVIANPNLPQNPNNFGEFAFAPYNVNTGAYENFYLGIYRTEEFPLISGNGYRASTYTGGNLTFTGSVTNTNVNVAVSDAAAGAAWNLVGNPYPSYIDVEEFFTANNINQLNGQYVAIYGYKGNQNDWQTYNLATSNELLAPGQGFFVKAQSGGGLLQFTPQMRRSGSSDDFIQGRQENTLKALSRLKVSNNNNTVSTRIYFIEGTTRGLDLGYDAAVYSATAVNFSIYTDLLEDNTGLEMTIQSLPYNDFNDVIVPLGIKANAGTELRISIDDESTLPSNVNVYLEDTQNNTLTLLNTNDFVFTPSSAIDGSDRFNVHYSSTTLTVVDIQANDNLRIYTTAIPRTLFIKGRLTKATTANLYDIQGRLVLSQVLNPNTTNNTMDISTVSTGVYVVKVNTDHKVKTQKVIIK